MADSGRDRRQVPMSRREDGIEVEEEEEGGKGREGK
jgi:hypothetical protein